MIMAEKYTLSDPRDTIICRNMSTFLYMYPVTHNWQINIIQINGINKALVNISHTRGH